ncbi:MAG: dihydrolipoyllysine-residue acetyltransferase [Halieaceae bacterium]|jgi:pyruvate dehydrogenase E2 component (dihydrolipoamide acetyltransferase)|nr:dihydrolipoyllysine-residue acetyltransferase [Halieaceae bacterium]
MTQETVLVPDIGSDAAEVVELLVAPGDTVELEQGLIVLESDKASMEVPSTVAGTVVEVLATVGSELAEGAAVAVIETAAAAGEDQAAATSARTDDASTEKSDEKIESESPEQDSSPSSNDGASRQIVVPVPDIGTEDAVDIIEIAVKPGDRVAVDDTLVVLESDKASMEVPSPAAGRVVELRVSEGAQVREGDALLLLEADGAAGTGTDRDAAAAKAAAAGAPGTSTAGAETASAPAASDSQPLGASSATAASAPMAAASAGIYAGPAVRRMAREFGVELGAVRGSGPRGRILKEDLQEYVKRALERPASGVSAIPEIPEVDFSAFGAVEVVERSKIDRVTADNMQRSWLNVPHVTQFDDADITDLEAFRKSLAAEADKRGTRMTPMPFLLKACAVALRHHRKINASLSDGGATLTYKQYVHIAMAVDTPSGLLVPVLRDVDQKSLWQLAEEVIDLATRARDRKLKPAEMQGACFTISSLGAIGGRGFTPIINSPEVAILGVGKSAQQPVWDGKAFQPRLQLPLSLSYDHRVVNGGDAGRFLTELVELLGDLRRLLL